MTYKVAQLNWCLWEDSALMDSWTFLLSVEGNGSEWEYLVGLFTLLSLAADVLAEEIKAPYPGSPTCDVWLFNCLLFKPIPVYMSWIRFKYQILDWKRFVSPDTWLKKTSCVTQMHQIRVGCGKWEGRNGWLEEARINNHRVIVSPQARQRLRWYLDGQHTSVSTWEARWQ